MKTRAKKALILGFLTVILGCAGTRPTNQTEMWPKFNTDPTKGVVILEGAASCTIKFITTTTNELFMEWSDRGESPALTFNGRVPARVYITALPKGNWKLEIETFYYQNYIFPASRKLISLYRYTAGVWIGNDPRAFSDRQYTRKDWGWGVSIYTGDIPQYDYQSPTVDIQTTGIATDAVNFVRSLFR